MELLTFPRWKGEHTRRAAHAPRRRALHGLQEARAGGCPQRCRSSRCRPGESCHTCRSGVGHIRRVVGRRCSGRERNDIARGAPAHRTTAARIDRRSAARTPVGDAHGHDGRNVSSDSGASRRFTQRREQRRRNGSRDRSVVSFERGGRNRDAGLQEELVPFYRHALPMRTARPDAP